MEPTGYELKVLATAKLLNYVLKLTGQTVPHQIVDFARGHRSACISKQVGDNIVATMCEVMGKLTPEQIEELAYKPRTKEARALADWWEEHQAADAERVAVQENRELMAAYLFGEDADLPEHKRKSIVDWYAKLDGTGQSYVNLLLLIREQRAKSLHVTE